MAVSSSVTNGGNSVLITVSGRFDQNLHHDFRDCYYNENPRATYTLDFSETESLDSAALGILLLLREFAGGDSSNIKVRGCNERVKNIFICTNFEKLFSCL